MKRLSIIVLILFILSASGCNNGVSVIPTTPTVNTPTINQGSDIPTAPTVNTTTAETYPVFLESASDNSSFHFSDLSAIPTEPIAQPKEETKEFEFDGKAYTLRYTNSNNGYHSYTSEDGKIVCGYFGNSGLLRSITLSHYYEKGQPNYADEQQYIEAVKNLVSAYYDENWDEYKYHCETRISKDGGLDSYLGFINPKDESEAIRMRIFCFTKYINGFPTTDKIQVAFSPTIGSIVVLFSPHEFDMGVQVSPDMDSINGSIDTFFNKNINAEKSMYKGYTINPTITGEQGTLTIVNGELYFMCSVSVQTISKSGGLSGTERTTLCILYIKLPTE